LLLLGAGLLLALLLLLLLLGWLLLWGAWFLLRGCLAGRCGVV
jgi:hypothetical protein